MLKMWDTLFTTAIRLCRIWYMPRRTEGSVRWYRPEDLPVLAALFAEAFPKEKWTVAKLEKFAADHDKSNVLKVLEASDGIRGVLMYSAEPTFLKLHKLIVRADDRRRGFGKVLVRSLSEIMGATKRRFVRIEVPESMLGAQLFLRAAGFKPDPDAPIVYSNSGGEDAYGMILPAAAPAQARRLVRTV